jgi:hypothetical protein
MNKRVICEVYNSNGEKKIILRCLFYNDDYNIEEVLDIIRVSLKGHFKEGML